MDTYEKKYKEALERASKLRVQNPFDTVSQMMEHIFPELQNSEDEEIRQAMINFFKSERIKDGIAVLHFGVNIEKMITWLEKQKSVKFNDEKDERISKDIAWCIKHSGIESHKPINRHVTTTVKEALSWLEKQGGIDN